MAANVRDRTGAAGASRAWGLDLEARRDREQRLVGSDPPDELNGEWEPLHIEAPRQGEGGGRSQVPEASEARCV